VLPSVRATTPPHLRDPIDVVKAVLDGTPTSPPKQPPPPPPRRWSTCSERGAACGWLDGELPIQFEPPADEVEPPLEPLDAVPEDEPPPPLSRGTADPVDSAPAGRSRCPAQAGERVSVKADAVAINPTVSF